VIGFGNLSPDLDAIGNIRVVAGFFDAGGIVVAIAHCYMDGLAVRQHHRHFGRHLA